MQLAEQRRDYSTRAPEGFGIDLRDNLTTIPPIVGGCSRPVSEGRANWRSITRSQAISLFQRCPRRSSAEPKCGREGYGWADYGQMGRSRLPPSTEAVAA